MFPDQISIFIIGILAAALGAVPFGLVNLTVLDVSMNKGNKDVMKIAQGAALVEVAYGLIAIFAGGAFSKIMNGNSFISGIWLGQMVVLLLYMLLSKRILAHSRVLSRNINRIIGSILFGVAVFHALSM
jgi:threonine/homoserine/homoserine lactone efflux protein